MKYYHTLQSISEMSAQRTLPLLVQQTHCFECTFLHLCRHLLSSCISVSLEKTGSWLWGGILDWCPKLSHGVAWPLWRRARVWASAWQYHTQAGWQVLATENTHWYHCPQNNLFQRKDVSHLGGSGEKFKNIKQIQPKYLEKKKQKWQKLFGGLELRIGFKSRHFWSLSSLLCLNNHFQMTQIGMPMTCSTATFFSLLSWWKSPQPEKTSPGKRWH